MEVARDLVIIVLGVLGLLMFVLMGLFGLLIYRDVRRLTESIHSVIDSIKEISGGYRMGAKSVHELIDFIKSFQGGRRETSPPEQEEQARRT
jgi:hypothetical protein